MWDLEACNIHETPLSAITSFIHSTWGMNEADAGHCGAESKMDHRNGPKGQSDPSIVYISSHKKGVLVFCDSMKEKQLLLSQGVRSTEGGIGRYKIIASLN